MSFSDGVAIDEVESIEPVMIKEWLIEEPLIVLLVSVKVLTVVLVPLFPDGVLSKDNMKINLKWNFGLKIPGA